MWSNTKYDGGQMPAIFTAAKTSAVRDPDLVNKTECVGDFQDLPRTYIGSVDLPK